MRELGIIHCTDISREMPALDSDILYTRLFGHGEHTMYQFDDQELIDIDSKIRQFDKKKAYITFHGSRMYKDAARLKIYRKNGTLPNITNKTGLASLEVVLNEDTDFPAWKTELVEGQGWKVFDLTENERVHARTMLDKLPDKKYANVEEVIDFLKKNME